MDFGISTQFYFKSEKSGHLSHPWPPSSRCVWSCAESIITEPHGSSLLCSIDQKDRIEQRNMLLSVNRHFIKFVSEYRVSSQILSPLLTFCAFPQIGELLLVKTDNRAYLTLSLPRGRVILQSKPTSFFTDCLKRDDPACRKSFSTSPSRSLVVNTVQDDDIDVTTGVTTRSLVGQWWY